MIANRLCFCVYFNINFCNWDLNVGNDRLRQGHSPKHAISMSVVEARDSSIISTSLTVRQEASVFLQCSVETSMCSNSWRSIGLWDSRDLQTSGSSSTVGYEYFSRHPPAHDSSIHAIKFFSRFRWLREWIYFLFARRRNPDGQFLYCSRTKYFSSTTSTIFPPRLVTNDEKEQT